MQDFNVSEKNTADVHTYKCPSCGAQMEFSPEAQTLVCPHCRAQSNIEISSNVSERDFNELFSQIRWQGDIKTVQCENCGASETLAKKEISTRCPFCGSNTVLKTNELQSVQPDTVIPFKFNKETAVQKILKWVGKRFFAPREFKQNVNLETVAGTYNPVWTFDSSTRTTYKGVLGKRVTITTTVNGKTVTRTETRWFPVSGSIDCAFDDLYVSGSDRISEKIMNKLKPYDQRNYVQYNNDFLAGFAANNYTVQPLDAWKVAEQRMYSHIRQLIINRHNADVVQSLNMSICHMKKSFKYLLLPVYVAATRYKLKLYNLFVNGVHGKVAGKLPKSPLKILLVALAGIAVVAGAVILSMVL